MSFVFIFRNLFSITIACFCTSPFNLLSSSSKLNIDSTLRFCFSFLFSLHSCNCTLTDFLFKNFHFKKAKNQLGPSLLPLQRCITARSVSSTECSSARTSRCSRRGPLPPLTTAPPFSASSDQSTSHSMTCSMSQCLKVR